MVRMGKIFTILIMLLMISTAFSTVSSQDNKEPATSRNNELIGFWTFDEGAGSIAYDYSGNDNNGQINEAIWNTTAVSVNSLIFDGNNDYVNIGDQSEYSFEKTDDFSVSAWFYTHEAQSPSNGIVTKLSSEIPYNGWGLVLLGAYLSFEITSSTGLQLQKKTVDEVPTNTWIHVVATYDGSNDASGINIYVDGSLANTVIQDNEPGGTTTNTYPLSIGSYANQNRFFDGQIDEVRIYEKELTVSEVSSLFTNPGGNPGTPEMSGSEIGETEQQYTFNITSTDPDTQDLYYYVDWGDGTQDEWLGPYSSGETIQVSHAWSENGDFSIHVRAKDISEKMSDWETFDVFMNREPLPPTISGPAEGKKNTVYDYTFVVNDSDGDTMELMIDWGDETITDWLGPYDNLEQIMQNHSWDSKGTFTIKAKTRDSYGYESDWGHLQVTMPRGYFQPFPFLRILMDWFEFIF